MRMLALFSLLVCGFAFPLMANAAPVAFVPLDDRPVTRQLPELLGRIAGRNVIMPPRSLLGRYLQAGNPEAIIAWLNSPSAQRASAYVLSTDMLAYGGLVASRIPGTTYQDAYSRLREIHHIRREHPSAWIGAFGTIMRLAPTGIPATGPGAHFFAAYPVWKYLQEYANLHDPPLESEQARAAQLEALVGRPTLAAYVDTRARNLSVDLSILQMTQARDIDRVVLGQDDAGPVGLHVKDVSALQRAVREYAIEDRTSIEPGADELGMAMVANALSRGARWVPHIGVHYSTPGGALFNDPLEFAPISNAIDSLIGLCGGVHDDVNPDIDLFVRVPKTSAPQDDALFSEIAADVSAARSVAFADITFLGGSFAPQAAFAKRLMSAGLAGRIDAYSSWNTNANTVGTALAEAIAANAGRRTGTYNALAHAEFTFDRYVDDYAFHDFVRPDLNAVLDAAGVVDHTYLSPDQSLTISARNNAELWNRAEDILKEIYPNYHIAAIVITLPWDRTFETEVEIGLAPALGPGRR